MEEYEPVIKRNLQCCGLKLTFDNAKTDICTFSWHTNTKWKYEFYNSISEFPKLKFATQKSITNLWKGNPSQKRKLEFGELFMTFAKVYL